MASDSDLGSNETITATLLGDRPARYVRVAGRRIRVPASRALRMGLGGAFVLGGLLGFLPILGFWMLPLGLLVLSVDLPPIRRLRRRLEVRIGRWRARKAGR